MIIYHLTYIYGRERISAGLFKTEQAAWAKVASAANQSVPHVMERPEVSTVEVQE